MAQTVWLFSASSISAILLCMAATMHARGTAAPSPSVQVYTYQNPFNTLHHDPAIASTPSGILGRLIAPQFVLGVLSIGILWLSANLYLQRGRKLKNHMHRRIIPVSNPEPKMNPLAVLPRAMARASKEDNSRQFVFGRTTTLCSVTHRRLTAPCQSRFRPVYLIAHQQRFQRF